MVDVIVIGAGFSGLSAARILHEKNITFKLLEARERIGGRVYTKKYENGKYLDFGGQWIGPGQDRMYELCEIYGIRYFETYNSGKHVLDLNGKVKKYKGLIPKLDILSLINLDWVMRKIERLAKNIPLESPWTHKNATEWDNISLADFVGRNCKTKACHQVIRLALQTVFACELNEISLLHALFYIRSGNDLNTLINIKDGAQQHRIDGGMQLLADKIAERFKSEILFNHAVQSISSDIDGVLISGDGFELRCKKVIVAIPPPLIRDIRFTPSLAIPFTHFLKKSEMGKVAKCFMVYSSPFWRKAGFSGQVFSDESTYYQAMFDSSPDEGNYGIILAFSIGERQDRLFSFDKEKREDLLLEALEKYFGPEAGYPLFYEDFSMSEEPWSKGCYAALISKGVWTKYQKPWASNQDPIFWAGTEASTEWYGYIEGAVRAGEKAAKESIRALK